MSVENIKQTDLTQSEREVLKNDTARWKRMGKGGHLDDWLAYQPGLAIRRTLAMKLAHTNRPEGKGYAAALAQLMKSDGLDTMDKTSIHRSAVARRRPGADAGAARTARRAGGPRTAGLAPSSGPPARPAQPASARGGQRGQGARVAPRAP